MEILTKLFQRRGIKDVNELTPEERSTFENYRAILEKKEVTIEDVKYFLKAQVVLIEKKWADLSLKAEHKGELIPYHTAYKLLLEFIETSVEGRREALIKTLESQL